MFLLQNSDKMSLKNRVGIVLLKYGICGKNVPIQIKNKIAVNFSSHYSTKLFGFFAYLYSTNNMHKNIVHEKPQVH